MIDLNVPQIEWEVWGEEARRAWIEFVGELMYEHFQRTGQHLELTCTCLTWCGEGSEAGCPHCVITDIYAPCPVVGSGCGIGYTRHAPKTCDEDCCSADQWDAATRDKARQEARLGRLALVRRWSAATDPTCPPGVVKFDGQPFPLIEFTEDRDV